MWKYNLVEDMKDPSKLLFADHQIAILRDAYPKAERHFLVLPKENISSLASLKKGNVELLKHMDLKGREIAERYGEGRTFRLGYHVEPSMERLHLHVISDDMNSPSLKRIRHWNKFTTPLFMDSQRVIEDLEKRGKIQFPSEQEIELFLNAPLKCHKCSCILKDMRSLKCHLQKHLYSV
uniref:Aprataxin n=2 Tax=Lygus hesperus TaxID=30085 RepID=A0A0A9Y078_LYGHE